RCRRRATAVIGHPRLRIVQAAGLGAVDAGRARLRRGRPGGDADPRGCRARCRRGNGLRVPRHLVLAADSGRRRRVRALPGPVRITPQGIRGPADDSRSATSEDWAMNDRYWPFNGSRSFLFASSAEPSAAAAAVRGWSAAPPELCLTSPSPEALQTAEAACGTQGVRLRQEPLLARRGPTESAADFDARRARVLRLLDAR